MLLFLPATKLPESQSCGFPAIVQNARGIGIYERGSLAARDWPEKKSQAILETALSSLSLSLSSEFF